MAIYDHVVVDSYHFVDLCEKEKLFAFLMLESNDSGTIPWFHEMDDMLNP